MVGVVDDYIFLVVFYCVFSDYVVDQGIVQVVVIVYYQYFVFIVGVQVFFDVGIVFEIFYCNDFIVEGVMVIVVELVEFGDYGYQVCVVVV